MSCSALLYSVSLIGENVTPVWHGSHGARFNTSVVEGHAERCHVSESENVSAPSVCVCVSCGLSSLLVWMCLCVYVQYVRVLIGVHALLHCVGMFFSARCARCVFLYSFHHGQNIRSGKGQCPCFQIHPICFYFDCIFNAMVNVR